jgi:hypothetical protein
VTRGAEYGAVEQRDALGGTAGNETLTSATAAVLTLLLAAEGITIVQMHGLRGAHMFIGMVLIPPIALKLGSTGYRFARYYTGARPYREKGPPALPLRLIAPLLVAATVGVFVSGVWLLAVGQKSDQVLFLHKLSFIVWGVVFAIHFLAHLPRMLGSLRSDWGVVRRRVVPGSGVRAMLVASTIGGGLALALAVLPDINAWAG